MIICFDFSTSDFEHAIQVCEVAFGHKGQEWERVKATQNMNELVAFLEADEIDVEII
jgi:hypothetical protein